MINFDELEDYVKSRSEVRSFVPATHLITHEEIAGIRSLIKKYKNTEVLKCFAPINPLADKFCIETKCEQCGALTKAHLSKAKLEEYINQASHPHGKERSENESYICSSCELKNKQKQNEIYKKERETQQAKLQENTVYYIKNYLNPNGKWNRETSAKQRIDWIRYADVNWTAITAHVKGMDYQDFLTTPYWKAIAAHTKYKAGYRCQLCNSANHLTTHHRNYGIHGREHAHMNELIVLCNKCHQKFHGFEEKIAQLRSVARIGEAARWSKFYTDKATNRAPVIFFGL